jgi:hypothetical protein
MLPSRGQDVAHFQRELAGVQSYIQARLQTEDPYLLNVNAADVAEYQDEIQHYVKQKQQLRRPLPTGRATANNARAAPRPTPARMSIVARGSASDRPLRATPAQPHSDSKSSVVPKRLPGVEWLFTNTNTQPPVNRCDEIHQWGCPPAPSIPVASLTPLPYVHGFAPLSAMHHRTLKKQKTM